MISKKSRGFTLIELIVTIAIIGTLAVGMIMSINPGSQISKGQDAQRSSDLQAIQQALDLYYNDNKCYPTKSAFDAILSQSDWKVGSAVYLKSTPKDPKCASDPSSCYVYITDQSQAGAACPQWNVLFTKLSRTATIDVCPLSAATNNECRPEGYSEDNWACTLSGAVNCTGLASTSLPGAPITPVTSTPAPPPTTGPTPTPTMPAGSQTYITLDSGLDPDAYQVDIMPLYREPNSGNQTIRVYAYDNLGEINSIEVILYSDGDAVLMNFDLTQDLVSGTRQNGVWQFTWLTTKTYGQVEGKYYGYDIIVKDDQNNVDIDRIRISKLSGL